MGTLTLIYKALCLSVCLCLGVTFLKMVESLHDLHYTVVRVTIWVIVKYFLAISTIAETTLKYDSVENINSFQSQNRMVQPVYSSNTNPQ